MSQSETSTQILEKILPSDFIPHRIFINHVDSFVAKHFTSFITDQLYGATRIENSPEEAINEEQEEQTTQNVNLEADSKNYEIIGTLRYPFNKKTEDILYTIRDDDENYLEEILRCGFIVYDITQDNEEIVKVERILKAIKKHLKKIEEIGPKTYEKYTDRRVFILLSTVMTWAKTKSTDSSVPFSEIDYRRRRPHPNYKKHLDCEKQVIQAGRKFSDKFNTYVLCSGIIYGHEEQDFDFLFKLAWNNERYLPIFNKGDNFVPLIHVDDLSRIFHRLMENPPNKPQYIVAVEETPTTLRKICNQLSRELGSGMCKNVPVEEAFFYPTIKVVPIFKCLCRQLTIQSANISIFPKNPCF